MKETSREMGIERWEKGKNEENKRFYGFEHLFFLPLRHTKLFLKVEETLTKLFSIIIEK